MWPTWWVMRNSRSFPHLLHSYFIYSNGLLICSVLFIPVGSWPRPRISSQEPLPHRRCLPWSRFLSSRTCPSPTTLHAPAAHHRGGAATDALPAGRCLCPSVAHLSGQHGGDHPPRGHRQPPSLQPSRPRPQTLGSLVPSPWPFPCCK